MLTHHGRYPNGTTDTKLLREEYYSIARMLMKYQAPTHNQQSRKCRR